MYAKKSILFVSLESEKIETEEIYFRNRDNKWNLSFKKDNEFLDRLNIHDVFFEKFNFNARKSKYDEKLKRLQKINPSISEVYILIDNDRGSFSKEQIEKKVRVFNSSLSSTLGEISPIYLEYERDMMKFEDFLKLHSKNQKLFIGYKKSDKLIYEKTMGKNGKNLKQLLINIDKKQVCLKFKKIFEKRKHPLT